MMCLSRLLIRFISLYFLPPSPSRVAESIDPADSGVGLASDGHLGLAVPDIKVRVEGLPGAERCDDYVFKVRT